jgi:2-polyprenyl-6-methoxyphenol hydroxylase-like FAD-dependent oxidoreductase
MSARTAVLVVGGGPVGLAAAAELRRFGVSVRLVDAALAPATGPRALQLWPSGLAVLDDLDMLGEADRLGQRIRAMRFHLNGRRRFDLSLGAPDQPLLLPQPQTEELLERALRGLGGTVERGIRVTGVEQTATGVRAHTEGPDGRGAIDADWLIAADGVRSTVRAALDIEFPGERVPLAFLLAEGRLTEDIERGAAHYFLHGKGSLVFAPLRDGTVRISSAIPPGTPLTEETVQRLLDERGPGGLRLAQLDVVREFASAERIAARLRVGRCFLAGDAAHTHSPLGGQGLNLGLQDVRNLAWKLAGVVSGALHPDVLDSYEPERRQAAEQTVRATHNMMRVFMLPPLAAKVRDLIWQGLESAGVLRRWFVPLLAGRRVRYALPGPGRQAGARAPDWATAHPVEGRLVLVTGGAAADWARALSARWPQLVAHHLAAGRGRHRRGFLLVRPDGHVTASGAGRADRAAVTQLLGALAGPATGSGQPPKLRVPA